MTRGSPVPKALRCPRFEEPAVDVRIEGWAHLVRALGFDDGRTIRWPDPPPARPPHDTDCDCCSCLDRVGVGTPGVRL